MKKKEIIKRVALLTAGISAVCIGYFVVPAVARAVDAGTEYSQENKALPKITIDSEGYGLEEAPKAVVGKQYRTFNATATDNYGNDLKVTQKVWLYYYSSTKSRVAVQNGVFTPQQIGEYVIEYTAIDSDGNKGSAIYAVKCASAVELAVSLGEKSEIGVAGVEMQLAQPIFKNVSGETSFYIEATHKVSGKSQTIKEDLIFRPMYAGEYIVEYFCSDYVTQKSVSYEISVEENDIPVFLDEVSVPKYFVKNKTYSLDIPRAYQFALGVPVEIEPVIAVEDMKGNVQVLNNGEFTPTAEGEIVVRYSIAYGENKQELTYQAKVKDVDYGLLNSYHKYFDAENYTVSLNKEGVEFFTMTDNAEANFINPILANKANVVFSASKKYANFKTLDIYFTDAQDSSIEIKFSFKDKADGGMVYTINDNSSYSLTTTLSSGKQFELNYRNADKAFNFNKTIDVIVRKTLSGADFFGFPSGRVYVKFCLTGVNGTAGYSVHNLNNQNLNLIAMDSEPEIVFTKHENGEMEVGDIVAINPFYVGDVLDYDSIVKFYVLNPKGEYVVATDGTLLDGNNVDYYKQYSIIMEMKGVYNVCMEISDSLGNSQLYAYGITSVDKTAPTIVLSEGKTTGKVGEKIEVREAKSTDAVGTELKTYVYVYMPDGRIREIADGYFYAEKVGIYTVYYHTFDAKGLAAMQSYQITVF